MAQKNDFPYLDILNLSYPFPSRRAKMSMVERAAQFAPFAALTGYEDAIAETARLTGSRIELDDTEKEALDRKIQHLTTMEKPLITVTYYVPDSSKEGGAYVTVTAGLLKADAISGCLILDSGSIIPMADMIRLTAPDLEE